MADSKDSKNSANGNDPEDIKAYAKEILKTDTITDNTLKTEVNNAIDNAIDKIVNSNPNIVINKNTIVNVNNQNIINTLGENDVALYTSINLLIEHVKEHEVKSDNNHNEGKFNYSNTNQYETNLKNLLKNLSELQVRVIINRCEKIKQNIPHNPMIINLFSEIAKALANKIATLNSIDDANRRADKTTGSAPTSFSGHSASSSSSSSSSSTVPATSSIGPAKGGSLSIFAPINNSSTEDFYKHKYKKYKHKYLNFNN
jgi:hypothetical protein